MPRVAPLVLGIIVTALVAGCAATRVSLQPLSGSKADGTVVLGLEYGGFQRVEWQWDQGQQVAQQRCSAWGYSGAQRFNDGMQTCIQWNSYGCLRYRLTVEYQCTGG